jgi:uncharacterized protein YaiE (UPF0345 family)
MWVPRFYSADRAGRAIRYNRAMSTPTLKHNIYFSGNVQSVGFERNGRRATVGVIAPGEYHFATEAPERMTIVSGELGAKPDGGAWSQYPAGTSFEIGGRSGFDVRAAEPCAYLCEFL